MELRAAAFADPRRASPPIRSDATACERHLSKLLGFVEPEHATGAAGLLIGEFGSLGATLCAPPEALGRIVGGELPAFLAAVHGALEHALRHQVAASPLLGNLEALLDYLRLSIANMPCEHLRVLYLNARNMLIRDELITTGDIGQVQTAPRRIIQRALEVGATGLILAHNHPSGDSAPSPADRKWTQAVARAAELVEIQVHDHVIVSPSGFSSLRALGWM